MVAATAKLLEWFEKGYFNEGMLGTSYLDANSLFITGQAAINIGGTWAQPEFATQPEFEARWFPMPQMDPSLEWHAGGKTPSDLIVVTSYAEDQAAALAFLDYMLSEENARRLWDAGKFVTYQFEEVPPPVNQLQADIYAGHAGHRPRLLHGRQLRRGQPRQLVRAPGHDRRRDGPRGDDGHHPGHLRD